MLFELSFMYFIFNFQIVHYFVFFMDVIGQFALIFSPLIKFLIICFYLSLLAVDTYMNYIINSVDFISTEMAFDSNEEIPVVILEPLSDYEKAYNTSMLKKLQGFGNVYLIYKKLVRPLELLYKRTIYLPLLYSTMNEHFINKLYECYNFICSLWITIYLVNKVKMYFIRKTISTVMNNPHIQTNIMEMVRNMNTPNKTINVNTTKQDQISELKMD